MKLFVPTGHYTICIYVRQNLPSYYICLQESLPYCNEIEQNHICVHVFMQIFSEFVVPIQSDVNKNTKLSLVWSVSRIQK